MRKTIEEKRLAILNETITYYGKNPKRRCVTSSISGGKICFYDGSKNTKLESDGCAVGRLLSKRMKAKLDKKYTFSDKDSGVKDLFHELPKTIQVYGEDFLEALQQLHDSNIFWAEFGLTKEGKKFVKSIKNKYCN